jgi:hypothetical protein
VTLHRRDLVGPSIHALPTLRSDVLDRELSHGCRARWLERGRTPDAPRRPRGSRAHVEEVFHLADAASSRTPVIQEMVTSARDHEGNCRYMLPPSLQCRRSG